jgi:uncharacterized cofD-like protein
VLYTITTPNSPHDDQETFVKSRPEIVVVGGGTGTYTALMGLKHHQVSLTAVVSMADDGGSSGRLRDEFGHLPPGDVRRCLLALSADESATMLRRLFEYRFDRGNGLNGHSFGNLLLTVLTELTGSTDLAIFEAARLLNVKGTVLPVTLSDSRLGAELEDGTVISGESKIDVRTIRPESRIKRVFLAPPATANPVALAAIARANVIVIGPGDLYTSVVPNLLVDGIPEAIERSDALKVYVCNLMTKHGETDGYRASDFIQEVQRYLGSRGSLHHVIVNDASNVSEKILRRYVLERAAPVEANLEDCANLGPQPCFGSFAVAGTLLRHDPARLATAIMKLAGLTAQGHGSRVDLSIKESSDRYPVTSLATQ